MPNRSADPVFLLIKSLTKAEKRNFKLYIQRNTPNKDLKIIQVFDSIDRMDQYDEAALLKRNTAIKKQQVSNIKAHLYRQILTSLRLLRSEESIDMQLHEQLDHARILYNKGLYLQSLKILDKLKELAQSYNQDSFLIQIISLEKKIETLHITRSLQDRAERLAQEAVEIQEKRRMITRLSNLALQLYGWYIRNGHARNKEDEAGVRKFFVENLPEDAWSHEGFYEKLYLYQSYCWYAFIRQDFLQYYRYTQLWVSLFEVNQQMIRVETGHYIKGMHNLLNAHFDLRNYRKFDEALNRFEKFAETASHYDMNVQVQTFVYLNTARLNRYFMTGTFREGLPLVSTIEEKLKEYELYLDNHRILVFYYKIASLYFGAEDYGTCIQYLNRIINWKVDLRIDIQCYARILHMLAHYELQNYDIMDYLTRSVYRFLAKMENLTVIEEQIFSFIRNTFHISPRLMKPEFEKLYGKIRGLEKDRFETRAFAYLDIISWLESKLQNEPMARIIRQKYLKSKRSN